MFDVTTRSWKFESNIFFEKPSKEFASGIIILYFYINNTFNIITIFNIYYIHIIIIGAMRKAFRISNIHGMPLHMQIYKDEHTFVLKEYAHKAKNKWQTISNDVQTQVTASQLLNAFNKLLKSNDLNEYSNFK